MPPRPPRPGWGGPSLWTGIAAFEVALAALAVILDVFIPALVLLVLAAFSLALRRQGLETLGVCRPPAGVIRMVFQVVLLTLGWNVLTVLVFLPLLEFMTGTQQDVSGFTAIQGDVGLLLLMLALSWTLAAIAEEFAFRGYVQTRMRELLPGRWGLAAAIVLSSVLFGLIHREQGIVGVIVTTADGIFFSVLRYRFRTLWAAVTSHGVSNTVGMIVFFLVGPVQAPW